MTDRQKRPTIRLRRSDIKRARKMGQLVDKMNMLHEEFERLDKEHAECVYAERMKGYNV